MNTNTQHDVDPEDRRCVNCGAPDWSFDDDLPCLALVDLLGLTLLAKHGKTAQTRAAASDRLAAKGL